MASLTKRDTRRFWISSCQPNTQAPRQSSNTSEGAQPPHRGSHISEEGSARRQGLRSVCEGQA